MSDKYKIVTNLEKADITKTEGWVIMEVSGTGDDIDRAFQWMADQGVIVQTMFPKF